MVQSRSENIEAETLDLDQPIRPWIKIESCLVAQLVAPEVPALTDMQRVYLIRPEC